MVIGVGLKMFIAERDQSRMILTDYEAIFIKGHLFNLY